MCCPAAQRGNAEIGYATIGALVLGQLLQRVDAVVVELLPDHDAHQRRAAVERQQDLGRTVAAGQLERVGGIGHTELDLAGTHEIAQVRAAAGIGDFKLHALVGQEPLGHGYILRHVADGFHWHAA